jgi:hypothetical protein
VTDEKAFVDSAVETYASDPVTFGACIDTILQGFSQETTEDQDRIVAEVWRRIRAGDQAAAAMRQLIEDWLIQGVAELSPEQREETVRAVCWMVYQARARHSPPAPN